MADDSPRLSTFLALPEIAIPGKNGSGDGSTTDISPRLSISNHRSGLQSSRKGSPGVSDISEVRPRLKLRARNADIKTVDPQSALPVQPWSSVRSAIATILGSKNGSIDKPSISGGGPGEAAVAGLIGSGSAPSRNAIVSSGGFGGSKSHAGSNSDAPQLITQQQLMQQNPNLPNLPITITHGFQLLRSLPHSRPILSVLYIPTSGMFVSLDTSFVNLWKGSARIQRLSTQPEKDNFGTRAAGITVGRRISKSGGGDGSVANNSKGSSGTSSSIGGKNGNSASTTVMKRMTAQTDEAHSPGIIAITKWIFLEKQRIYIVANTHLELKVLNAHFEELNVISNPKPVLSMQYVPEKKEIICGEVGSIRIWKIIRSQLIHKELFNLEERCAILRDLDEEWVAFVYYDRLLDRIFAACDTNLYVYDYESGERIDNYYNIHDLAITCITFYEPFEYLITGGKDGSIKVWNARKYLMFDFHDHFNAVTSLALLEKGCDAGFGTMPLLLSSSLDATIRMWNFETGQSLYRFDTALPCLGIAFIKKNQFYHYTKDTIQVWNVNRYQMTFVFFKSTPLIIRRAEHPSKPARIVTAVADGSIKLISPVSGVVIATGFPAHKDSITKDFAYDINAEMLYSFNSNGDIIVYDTNANPFKILDIWEATKVQSHEQIACICGLDYYRHVPEVSYDADSRTVSKVKTPATFFLVAGTESGQVLLFNLAQHGKYESLAQAHSAGITMLAFDPKELLLLSGAKDCLIKVWSLRIVDNKASFGNTLVTGAHGPSALRSLSMVLKATISLNGFGVPSKNIALALQTNEMAVPFNGGIVVSNYTKDTTLTTGKVEQEQIGKVCAVASGHSFGIWATGNDDGTVKIWDADNIIIREIQFDDIISSLCFANPRGDLLVGISDQISIVRVQDYMPYNYLKSMMSIDYEDDETELAITFDPNLDFWEYRYETERQEQGEVSDWHIPKGKVDNVKVAEDDLDYLLQLSQIRREDCTRRRNRERFLTNERSGFMRALRFEKERQAAEDAKEKAEEQIKKYGRVVGIDEEDQNTEDQPEKIKPSKPLFLGRPMPQEESKTPKIRAEDDMTASSNINRSDLYIAENIEPSTPTNEVNQKSPVGMETQPDKIAIAAVMSSRDQVGVASAVASGLVGGAEHEMDESPNKESIKLGPGGLIETTSKAASDSKTVLATKTKAKPADRDRIRQKLRRDGVALPNSAFISEATPSNLQSNDLGSYESGKTQDTSGNKVGGRSDFTPDTWGNAISAKNSRGVGPGSKKPKDRSMASAFEAAHKRRAKNNLSGGSFFDESTINLDDDDDVGDYGQIDEYDENELESSQTLHPKKSAQKDSSAPKVQDTPADDAKHSGREDTPDSDDLGLSKSKSKRSRKSSLKKRTKQEPARQTKDAQVAQPSARKEKPTVPDVDKQPKKSGNARSKRPKTPQPTEPEVIVMPQVVPENNVKVPEAAAPDIPTPEQNQNAQVDSAPESAQETDALNQLKLQRPITSHIDFQQYTPHVVDIATAWDVRQPTPEPAPYRPLSIKRNTELYGEGKGGASAMSRIRKTANSGLKGSVTITFGNKDSPHAPLAIEGQEPHTDLASEFEKYKKKQSALPRSLSSESVLVVEEAAHFIWDMFRKKNKNKNMSESLKPLAKHFSSMEPDERIEITTVAGVLNNVLKSGSDDQKVDASKALLFLYRTFRTDFRDPLDQFIIPQIDLLAHDNPQVRATLCQNIAEYDVHHETVLMGLIYSLNDSNQAVVDAAKHGLARFGITDKEMLRAAMIHLGMIEGQLVHFYENALLERMGRTTQLTDYQHARQTNWNVVNWLKKLDANTRQIRRKDSYSQHLAGKFFPPDAGDPEAMLRARMLNELSMDFRMGKKTFAEMPEEISLAVGGNINGWDVRNEQAEREMRLKNDMRRKFLGHSNDASNIKLNIITEQSRHNSEHASMRATSKHGGVSRSNANKSRGSISASAGMSSLNHQSKEARQRTVHMRASLRSSTTPHPMPPIVMMNTRVMAAGVALAQRTARRPRSLGVLRPTTTGCLSGIPGLDYNYYEMMNLDSKIGSRIQRDHMGGTSREQRLRPYTVAATNGKDAFPPL